MNKFDTKVQFLKYEVLREVARHAWQDDLLSSMMDIPREITQSDHPGSGYYTYKEMAILSERVKLAVGGDRKQKGIVQTIGCACDECPTDGYRVTDSCRGCFAHHCQAVCPKDAIRPGLDSSEKILNCKITEYANAVLDGRPSYCINIVRDISPNCDCHAENDVPIVPDVGMFASADPVALDLACAEAVNRQPVMPNCAITDLQLEHDCDRFHAAHDNTHWQDMIEHGKKLGLGSDEYEIVNIH